MHQPLRTPTRTVRRKTSVALRATAVLAVAASVGAFVPGIAAAESEEPVSGATATFPSLGVTVDVEKIEEGDGFFLQATLKGRPVDFEGLVAREAVARRKQLGSLDAALAAHLKELGQDDRVPVALWLEEAERDLEKRPDTSAGLDEIDALFERRTAERAEQVAALTAPWLEMLREHDAEVSASTTSPVVWASLPVGLIRELASDERIDTLYGDLEKGGPTTNLSRRVVGADSPPALGLTGAGVQVGVVEWGGLADPHNPFLSVERQEHGSAWGFPNCYAVSDHATKVAGVIGARPGSVTVSAGGWPFTRTEVATSNLSGFANAARLFVGGWCNTGDNRDRVDGAVNWGARIVNNSYWTDATGGVTVNDRHADGVVHNSWRTFVTAAGNRGDTDALVISPANGYNALTVGNVNLNFTDIRGDDVMSNTSSFVDPTSMFGDREKPEVAAPGTNIEMLSAGFPYKNSASSGTSFAAPTVAGTAARLLERKPGLASWPEQLRAVLMASAVNNIEGSERLSDVDGAGMIAADTAVRILDDNRHDGLHVNCATFGGSQTVNSVQLQQGQRLRAAISWTDRPVCVRLRQPAERRSGPAGQGAGGHRVLIEFRQHQ